jgi:hypothetical protein
MFIPCQKSGMLSVFFAIGASEELSLSTFLVGEWSGTIHRSSLRSPIAISRFTITFQPKPDSRLTEGTLWRDDLNSTEMLPFDSFLLSHFEISWEGGATGHVFRAEGDKRLLTKFEFQGVMGGVASYAKLSFERKTWVDLTLYNKTYFSAILSTKESSGTAEYFVLRAQVPAVKPRGGNLKKWGAIAAVVIVVEVMMFWGLRRYSAGLTQKIEDLKSQTIIDLDQTGPAPAPGPVTGRRKRKAE